MSAHTPGPWKVVPFEYGSEWECLYNAQGEHVGCVNTGHDAHLIAAAPRMLAELKRLISWTPSTPPDYARRGAASFTPEASFLIDRQNVARAILRDVEGESNE